jgi:hypothetical protein
VAESGATWNARSLLRLTLRIDAAGSSSVGFDRYSSGGQVGVAHRRLGVLQPGVARDVVAVGVAEGVGGDLGRYPGAARHVLHEPPNRLLGGGGAGVVAPVAVAARIAEPLRRQHVLVVGHAVGDLAPRRLEVGYHGYPAFLLALADSGVDPHPACAAEVLSLHAA